jgi:glucose/arabinose dehydrogenase
MLRAVLALSALAVLLGTFGPQPARASPLRAVTWPTITLTSVVAGLSAPVHITHAGDGSGRIFITERAGRIRILGGGSILAAPFLDITSVVRDTGSEQGLLSVAFPPDYASKGYFYVYYTDDRVANRGNNVVSRFHLGADATPPIPQRRDAAHDSTPDLRQSQRRAIGLRPGGLSLYRHRRWRQQRSGQQRAEHALAPGQILRIDVGDRAHAPIPSGAFVLYIPAVFNSSSGPYAIPPSNPFFDNPAYRGEIWALGLRNPWRFSFDRATGDLYIADVGQSSREEVDYQPAASGGGENYGWRCKEGSLNYNFSGTCSSLTLVAPVAEYDHTLGCSISGGFVFRGPGNAAMQGIYFYSDYCSGRIWGLQRDGGTWVTAMLLDSPYSVSTFGEDQAGHLYMASYGTGVIYQVNQVP